MTLLRCVVCGKPAAGVYYTVFLNYYLTMSFFEYLCAIMRRVSIVLPKNDSQWAQERFVSWSRESIYRRVHRFCQKSASYLLHFSDISANANCKKCRLSLCLLAGMRPWCLFLLFRYLSKCQQSRPSGSSRDGVSVSTHGKKLFSQSVTFTAIS